MVRKNKVYIVRTKNFGSFEVSRSVIVEREKYDVITESREKVTPYIRDGGISIFHGNGTESKTIMSITEHTIVYDPTVAKKVR